MHRTAFHPIVVLLASALAVGCSERSPTAVGSSAPDADAAAATSSFGQPPETGVVRAEFPDVICGIDVMTSFFRAGTTYEPEVPGGPPVRTTGTARITWTNPLNGKSLEFNGGGQILRQTKAIHPDGSFTVRDEFLGLGVQLKLPNGPVLSFAAGRVVVEILVTPLPGGGFMVSDLEVLFLAGPRPPESELQSPAFCAVVIDALT